MPAFSLTWRPTIARLAERRTVVASSILRSLVRNRLVGIFTSHFVNGCALLVILKFRIKQFSRLMVLPPLQSSNFSLVFRSSHLCSCFSWSYAVFLFITYWVIMADCEQTQLLQLNPVLHLVVKCFL